MNETPHTDGVERMPQRMVDTNAYISTLCELVNEGREVVLTVTGSSMSPFLIHQRDAVMLGKMMTSPQRGDIVLFRREDDSYVVHRVRKVSDEGYYMIGDGQTETEGPVPRKRLCAIVTKVRRKSQWFGSNDVRWRFFASVWLAIIPLRKFLVKAWRMIERIRR